MVSFLNLRVQLNESIRQGLPHITTMDTGQFHNLIHQGHVPLHHVTEKTDGSTFLFGHDKDGFYTQSSGSGAEKMRTSQHHLDRVARRAKETGRDPDYTGARAFAEAHDALQRNPALQEHLKQQHQRTGQDVQVRGELFSRQLSRSSDEKKGEVKIVGTSYDPTPWGKVGHIVIHSSLPENANHDLEHFKNNLGSDEINFNDDKINVKPTAVNVKPELKAFSRLNHELLRSRTTKTNKEAKLAEVAKFEAIKKSASDKVDQHVQNLGIRGKFGSGSEGLVIHPGPNSVAPRFKVTTPQYRQYKQDIKSGKLPAFKDRNKQASSVVNLEPKLTYEETFSFKKFLAEGGNIKVKTLKGEVSAAPFPVTAQDRAQRAGDIKDAMSSLHDAFHKKFKEHLFGKNKKALVNNTAFQGSTRQFMDTENIPDDEYAHYKSTTGDTDVAIQQEHKDKLASFLKPGAKLGKYKVIGSRGHGNQVSFALQHPNGEVHQFDFEGSEYKNDEPTQGAQFLNSSNWEDTKIGIKGAHHKILLNAVGGDKKKFSITHGLRSRTDETDPGVQNPEDVSRGLFGNNADHSNVISFKGVTSLIKNHIPQEQHQAIYDKFKDSLKKTKGDHKNALGYLSSTLGIQDKDNSEQHTSVIPFVGFSPISHMGHAADLGESLKNLPGTKHIGISEKADAFSPSERVGIMNRQWGDFGQKVTTTKNVGEVLRKSYDSLPEGKGRKVLHLLLGADRQDYGENLRRALQAGKIKEMEGNKFDRIELHAPQDTERSHGMSGTNMRQAAADQNIDEFHRHLGSAFKREEASTIMGRVKQGIESGQIPLSRGSKKKATLKEEMSHDEFEPLLKSFSEFAANELKLKKIPNVDFKGLKDHNPVTSFGGYSPSTKEILIQTKNRHPMDIFRTLAHEFVHAKQHEDDRIGHDIEAEGRTGSEHENEANAIAGIVMRKFGRKNPKYFELESLAEAIFVVGGPCCGKDRVVKYLKEAFFIPEFDITTFNKKVAEQNDKIIISAPAHDLDSIRAANEQLRELNYKTSMIFVNVENNISKLRNEERAKRGQRVINESVRFEKFTTSQNNLEHFKTIFDKDLIIVENSIKEDKDPCWKGYEMIGMKKKGAKKVPNCVPVKEEGRCWKGYEPVAGKKPFSKGSCKPISEMDKQFIDAMTKQDKLPGATTVYQPLAEKECNCEKCKCEKPKKKIVRKRLAQEAESSSLTTTAGAPKGLPVADSEAQTFSLVSSPSTIGSLTGSSSPMSLGIYPSVYGLAESVQRWMMKEETQQKFIKKYGNLAEQKLIEAGQNISNSMNTKTDLRPKHFNQLREEIQKTKAPGASLKTMSDASPIGASGSYQDGKDVAEENATVNTVFTGLKPGTDVSKLTTNPVGKPINPNIDKSKLVKPLEEDWSDVKHQDPRGGLKASGVRAYRREHPGSKLKTAVREKPSQLKKGGKRWKRRKSFCSRMQGMKRKLTSAKTANDPNSRINKSLRAWNCEE